MNQYETVIMTTKQAANLESATEGAFGLIRTRRNMPFVSESLISANEIDGIVSHYELSFNDKLKLLNAISLEVGLM